MRIFLCAATGVTFFAVKRASHPYAAALLMDYLTQAHPQELLDKAKGVRLFGNTKGAFVNELAEYSNLHAYNVIAPERFNAQDWMAEGLFVRN